MEGGKWLFVEQMAVAVFKLLIIVVVHLQHPVHNPKGLGVVVAYLMMVNLYDPIV
jgi:hypothetical protein